MSSQQSLFDFDELPPSSAPSLLTIDLVDDGEDLNDDSLPDFMKTPDKRCVIWEQARHPQWHSWWTRHLDGDRLTQFARIQWAKPKRSASWNQFYQAMEIKTGAAKSVCRYCWKVYAYPERDSVGSSTSTLARHQARCMHSKSASKGQSQIDILGSVIVSSTELHSNGIQ